VVNVAARVTEEAEGGTVLVTSDVRDAVGDLDGVTWGRRRQVRLKGIPDKVTLLRVSPA